jgi:hypothetical protein
VNKEINGFTTLTEWRETDEINNEVQTDWNKKPRTSIGRGQNSRQIAELLGSVFIINI